MVNFGEQRRPEISLGISGTPFAFFKEAGERRLGKSRMIPMISNSVLDEEQQELLESVTDEEIIYLWRSIKGRGISEKDTWHAVVAGLALDMAFAKSKPCMQIEH